jgi:hypothetical protein
MLKLGGGGGEWHVDPAYESLNPRASSDEDGGSQDLPDAN